MATTNPVVKKGDRLILKRSNNGYASYIGQTFEVTTPGKITTSFNAKLTKSPHNVIGIYLNSGDLYCLPNREDQVAFLQERKKELREEIKEVNNEIDFLTKYEDEEEFVADKIDKLLKAKGKHAKAEILRELKRSNIL
jgi:allophanate hydrolase subunit 2